jgi:peptide-methionine (S)-S-oxide reductase
MKTIILAGGCFWGVEAYYKKLKGVLNTQVGYANGNYPNPTYEEICDEKATHAEAVYVQYDEKIITLDKLLEHLFRMIDPTSVNKQGHDEGIQYRTGVYFEDKKDELIAKQYIKKRQVEFKKPIALEIQPLRGFYDAETYHQDYLDKNPKGYCHVDFRVLRKEEMK